MSSTINFVGTPPFKGSFLPALCDNKYGYVDDELNINIPFVFDWAFSFEGEVAKVMVDDKFGIIDRTGSFLILPKFDAIDKFINGYSITRLKEKMGYISSNGIEVCPPTFVNAMPFNEGVAVVGQYGGMEYAEPDESMRIALSSTGRSSKPTKGYYYNKVLYGSIDEAGNSLMEFKFLSLSDMKDGRHIAVNADENYIIVDRYGDIVSKDSYSNLMLIRNRFVLASKQVKNWLGHIKVKYGIINMDESPVTDFEFDSYSIEKDALVLKKNDKVNLRLQY